MKLNSGDGWSTYHEDANHLIRRFERNTGCGWVIDPPWDCRAFPVVPDPSLYFCDNTSASKVLSIKGPPTWMFVWNCITSWFTPNRPMKRAKFCMWYGNISEYDVDFSDLTTCIEQPRTRIVSNTRSTYSHTPRPGTRLTDIFDCRITGMNKEHKHEKPIVWSRLLIGSCLAACHTIVDPYMGSGVFGRAALSIGKKYIGGDIDVSCVSGFNGDIVSANNSPQMELLNT